MNSNIPRPTTLSALLMSEGCWKITRHTFVATRECVLPGPSSGLTYEHIFKCDVTGVERRWGCDREEVVN